MRLLKKNFLSGVLVLIPLAVFAWMAWGVVGFIWGISNALPGFLEPGEHWSSSSIFFIRFAFTIAAWSGILISIALLGVLSKAYFGSVVLRTLGGFLQRIPVLGTIYSSLDQLVKTFAPGSQDKKFNRVVYVEYPRAGSWAVGFVTGPVKNPASFPEGYLNIFVPTVPNPTAGFHILVPENEVRESHMSVEEAFRNILSLGLVQPRG